MWWLWLVGIILFLLAVVFLWLFIAGADESRRRDKNYDIHEKKDK